MSKVRVLNGQASFWCPGCGQPHSISIDPANARQMGDGSKPSWTYNGNDDAPTFTPSVNYPEWCHFWVTDGKIQFLSDSVHELSGQTVELPEWRGWED